MHQAGFDLTGLLNGDCFTDLLGTIYLPHPPHRTAETCLMSLTQSDHEQDSEPATLQLPTK